MIYNQDDILWMRAVIEENSFDDCSWTVDDLTDIEVIHLYKSFFEEETFYNYYYDEEGEEE